MKLSKQLLSKAVAIAAICATMGTTTLAAPQGTFDTSEINITGQASRSVAPNYAILLQAKIPISMLQNLIMIVL